MAEKITVCYKYYMSLIEKEKLKKLLISNSTFLTESNIILQRLDEITSIQIYQDKVVRLYLKFAHYEIPTFIFLKDLPNELVWNLINLIKNN